MLRARQHAGVGDIEAEPAGFQFVTCRTSFIDTLLRQIGIAPAGEQVFLVPLALTMAHQHQDTVAHFSSPVRVAAASQASERPKTSSIE
jgi:hypothetical protein